MFSPTHLVTLVTTHCLSLLGGRQRGYHYICTYVVHSARESKVDVEFDNVKVGIVASEIW
jgi:hypothetical protein